MVVLIAIAVVAVLLATGAFSSSSQTSTAAQTPAQVIAHVTPSTVLVVSDQGSSGVSRGSGWVWDVSRGEIVTNAHVTSGGQVYTIGTGDSLTLQNSAQGAVVAGANARPATLLGQSLCEDIAVLRVSNIAGLKTFARLPSQSMLKIGTPVVALGYPATQANLQQPDYSANLTGDAGVVSQPRTTFGRIPASSNGEPATGPYGNVILTDTPINPGNSGGPLVDYQDRIVGMNTATVSGAQGQNYAIGIDRIDRVVPELIAGQKPCG